MRRKRKTTFPSHGTEIELLILCTHHRGRQLKIAQNESEQRNTLRKHRMEVPEEQESSLGKS